jgi:hypothetical protein
VIIILFVILATLLLFLVSRVFVRIEPGGFDLLAHWKGTQLLLQANQDPYSKNTADQIDKFLVSIGKGEDSTNYQFSNPLFSLLFYGPLSVIKNVDSVRIIWMTISLIFLLASGYLLLRILQFHRPVWLLIVLFLFVLFNFQTFFSLLEGNLLFAGLFFFILAIWQYEKYNHEAAGLLLALSLVEPGLFVLPVLLVLIAGIRDRGFKVLAWFAATLVFLVGFSMLFYPVWPLHYLVTQFEKLNTVFAPGNGGGFFSTNPQLQVRLEISKTVLLLTLLIIEWFFSKLRGNLRLIWLTCLSFAVSQILMPSIEPGYAVVIIPAVFLVIWVLQKRYAQRGSSISMVILAVLFISSWLFSGHLIPGLSTGFTPAFSSWIVVIMTILLLYWIRWWLRNLDTQMLT